MMRSVAFFNSRMFVWTLCGIHPVQAQIVDRRATIATIDSMVQAPIADGQIAGASVGVVFKGDTLVLKGYGYADLEHDVPTPQRSLYEIGSVTKQFTTTAILQLVDQGKIDLDADVTTYLPHYPTDGRAVTVRRLMDHTSGIKGYTEMPAFSSVAAERLPRDTLVALFGAEPWDFEPGDAMIYNNSAFFLLGLMIEQVTGERYEDYVQARLLEPAGMSNSRYCSNREILKGRAHGYDTSEQGLVRGAYMDHTWPYAAGSLCSTAGDLLAWNHALHGDGHGGKLLSSQAYRELITPGQLNDGTHLRYAKGLAVVEFGEKRMIAHGGGIPGYLSDLRYFPDDDLTIAVLINTTGPISPATLARSIAELVLGAPAEPTARVYPNDFSELAGTYTGAARGSELTVVIKREANQLIATLGESDPTPLHYLGELMFGRGDTRFRFVKQDGVVTTLQVDQVSGLYVLRKSAP